jgi:nucleoside-diphosphate-sugar epimerase
MQLAARGWRVRAASRRPAAVPAGGEVFATGDLTAFRSWALLLQGVEAVVHLANAAHVRRGSEADVAAARTLNVETTLRLAQAAAASGVRRLLYVSSVKVYGEETGSTPFDEASPLSPADPYARVKVEAEAALRDATAGRPLELVVLRPPLVYGPGVRANFLALMRLVALGVPLPFAAIDNRRSLLYVGNLAEAVCAGLEHPLAAGRSFLLRDGRSLSTPALCRALGEAFGRPVRLFRVAPRLLERIPGMVKLTRSLDIDDAAIRSVLGWRPPFGFEEALRHTADWYRGGARVKRR